MKEDLLIQYLNENFNDNIIKAKSSHRSSLIEVDYEDLNQFLISNNENNLFEDIEETIESMEEYVNSNNHLSYAYVRIKNIPHNYMLKDIDADNIGEFISTKAMVKTITSINPQMLIGRFECVECGKIYEIDVNELGTVSPPVKCECGCKTFNLIDDKSKFSNSKYVMLEEPLELRQSGSSVHIKGYMEGYIASSQYTIKPGAVCDVSGHFGSRKVVKRNGETKIEFLLTVHHIKPENTGFEESDLSDEELEQINELKNNPNIFQLLVDKLSEVFGHNDIKEGLILQLFEGKRPKNEGIRNLNDRWTIHILIIGDPGLGKTALMKSIIKNSPKVITASGAGASEAGLTAAVMKDELTQNFTIEGGAVVLGDGGILCIDEFDKLTKEQQQALNESMESMTQSISKAGINQTMSARTSFLCAANPKYSKFDPYKDIYSQINMPFSTLSRFDLIYVLEDRIDKEKDSEMAENILNDDYDEKNDEEVLDSNIFMKYITYAKKNIYPKLDNEARNFIKSFYVNTRQAAKNNEDAKPITMRDLKAIERLTVARAKCELRETATYKDAVDATRIYKDALKTLGLEPENVGIIRGEKSVKEINLINLCEEKIIAQGKEYGSFNFGKEEVADIKEELVFESQGKYNHEDVSKAYDIAWDKIMSIEDD